MTKAALRAEYRQRRKELSDDEINVGSSRIAEQFFREIPLDGLQVMHTFLPIRRHQEVDTWVLIHKVWATYPHILITIPRIQGNIPMLLSNVLTPETKLVDNEWGVPEAGHSPEIDQAKHDLDLVIVPLLAYDERGYRVGYGKGYYDRFLAACRPNIQKIGLSFFEPVPQIDDVNEFDIRLDACVTPEKVIMFG